LNTACNITSAAYKGVGWWEGWRGRVCELKMPLDTGNQVVCIAGQTDAHSSRPDHNMRRADIKWNSLRPQATLLMHPIGPTGSVLVLCGLIGLAKGHL